MQLCRIGPTHKIETEFVYSENGHEALFPVNLSDDFFVNLVHPSVTSACFTGENWQFTFNAVVSCAIYCEQRAAILVQ